MIKCGAFGELLMVGNDTICECDSHWQNAQEFSFVLEGRNAEEQPCTFNATLSTLVFGLLFTIALIITMFHAMLIRRRSQLRRNFWIIIGFLLATVLSLLRLVDYRGFLFSGSKAFKILLPLTNTLLSTAAPLFANKYIVYRQNLILGRVRKLNSGDELVRNSSRLQRILEKMRNLAGNKMVTHAFFVASGLNLVFFLLTAFLENGKNESMFMVTVWTQVLLALYTFIVPTTVLYTFTRDVDLLLLNSSMKIFGDQRQMLNQARIRTKRLSYLGFTLLLINLIMCLVPALGSFHKDASTRSILFSLWIYFLPMYFFLGGVIAIAVMYTYSSNKRRSHATGTAASHNRKTEDVKKSELI